MKPKFLIPALASILLSPIVFAQSFQIKSISRFERETTPKGPDEFVLVESTDFDRNGRVTKQIISGKKAETVITYARRPDGRISREETRSGDSKTVIRDYRYGPDGELAEIALLDDGKPSGRVELRFTLKGREQIRIFHDTEDAVTGAERELVDPVSGTLVLTVYDAEGFVISETTNWHDNSGRITRRVVRNAVPETVSGEAVKEKKADDGSSDSWIEYQYSGKGLLLTETEMKPDGQSVVSIVSLNYDENGNLAERKTERFDVEEKDMVLRYSYRFDRLGNWIERSEFDVKEKFGTVMLTRISMQKREITYHK